MRHGSRLWSQPVRIHMLPLKVSPSAFQCWLAQPWEPQEPQLQVLYSLT